MERPFKDDPEVYAYNRARALLSELSHADTAMLFRGQKNASWPLRSGLARLPGIGDLTFEQRKTIQARLLEEFRGACYAEELYPKDILEDNERLWRLAQHHGLPTNLLDWSRSPYVATFFAYDGAGTGTLSDPPAVWALSWRKFCSGALNLQRRRDGDSFDDDGSVIERYACEPDGVRLVDYAELVNRRIHRQMGLFSEVRHEIISLDDYVAAHEGLFPDATLIRIRLDPADQKVAINDLALMGLTPASLMADADGAARTAINRLSRFPEVTAAVSA